MSGSGAAVKYRLISISGQLDLQALDQALSLNAPCEDETGRSADDGLRRARDAGHGTIGRDCGTTRSACPYKLDVSHPRLNRHRRLVVRQQGRAQGVLLDEAGSHVCGTPAEAASSPAARGVCVGRARPIRAIGLNCAKKVAAVARHVNPRWSGTRPYQVRGTTPWPRPARRKRSRARLEIAGG